MGCSTSVVPTDLLNIGSLTLVVGITTLIVLIFQTKIFGRQSSLMAKQAAISETQVRASEAIAISLEPTWANPWVLRIGAKNEGKGIAHNLKVELTVIDSQGKSAFQGGTTFQSIGPNSTQEQYIEKVPGSAETADFQFSFSWTATASDKTICKGTYQISSQLIRIDERRREWQAET